MLTNNDTSQPHYCLLGRQSSDRIYRKYNGEHHLTKPAHPWTNDQVERMNRMISEATAQRFHYQITAGLKSTWRPFC